MKQFIRIITAFALFSIGATANAASILFDVEVTSVTGENLGTGFGPILPAGTPFEGLEIRLDETADLAAIVGGMAEFIILFDPGPATGSVAGFNLDDFDPTDGQIAFSGSLGGFTGLPIDGFEIFPGDFSLTLSVDPADAPVSAFVTTQDLINFLMIASIELDGFISANFINDITNEGFEQTINFATSEIPLPGALIFILSGIAGLFGVSLRANKRNPTLT